MKQSQELVDVHNALWASALSGASGTAMYWWWERLDQRDVYPTYRPVRDFIADVPWNGGEVQAASVAAGDERVRAVGLRAGSRMWLWLFRRTASWQNVVIEKRTPSQAENVEVELQELPAGPYRLQWWDTREGKVLLEKKASVVNGKLRVAAPPFVRDIACKISPDKNDHSH
jgi:hypothetical protein